MNAVVTDVPSRFAGNVLNKGFIPNLPYDCCIEALVFADRQGLHGSHVGPLPEVCASLCQSNIGFQRLVVKAGLDGDYPELVQELSRILMQAKLDGHAGRPSSVDITCESE